MLESARWLVLDGPEHNKEIEMKKIITTVAVLAFSAGLVSAAPLFQVDFQQDGITDGEQAGWQIEYMADKYSGVTSADLGLSSGVGASLNVTGATLDASYYEWRARGIGGNRSLVSDTETPLNGVFSDFWLFRGNEGTAELALTGLTAGMEYAVTFYHNDTHIDPNPGFANPLNSSFTPSISAGASGISAVPGIITNNNGDPASPNDFYGSSVISFVADGSAVTVDLATSNTNNYLILNGLEVSAVPEPATLGLLGLAFGGLVMMRRRRK